MYNNLTIYKCISPIPQINGDEIYREKRIETIENKSVIWKCMKLNVKLNETDDKEYKDLRVLYDPNHLVKIIILNQN